MHGNIISNKPVNVEAPKVRELYPQYLREAAANVVSFLEEYYEYMNREGFPSYELRHVITENDIDFTSEKYLDAIQGEIAKIVPNSAVIDRNTLYQRIVHYYKIKGTPESIDIFFKIFFDSLADIYYPNKDLFKLSEGNFVIPTKYFITSNLIYNQYQGVETVDRNGLAIIPTFQPTLGENFVISFTSLLYPIQQSDDGYFFTTNNNDYHDGNGFQRGKFELLRDTSGTYLNIQQDGSSSSSPRKVYFEEDIFDNIWRNIRIEYSANSDDLILTKVDASNFTVSNGEFTTLNQTFTKTSGTLWEHSTTADFKAANVSGLLKRKVNTLIEGQEYEICENTDNGNGTTTFTTYGAADNNVGTIFIANSTSAAADTTDGLVKHRPVVWYFEDSTGIKYIDNKVDTYHEEGAFNGSNRSAVSSVDDIINLKFINYSSGESVQTANIKVTSDGEKIAEETIPNNSGYTNAVDLFSILSRHQSINKQENDIRGRIAAFKIEGATSNNFEYRFTSMDANSINTLNDWSNNGNHGKITIENSPRITITVADTTNYAVEDTITGSITNTTATIESIPDSTTLVLINVSGSGFNTFDTADVGAVSEAITEVTQNVPSPATGNNEFWFWENENDAYGPLPSSLHPLPTTNLYENRDGFPSSEKKIQDSEFWQDFSYQISTETSPELWRESYSRLVHPSGMKFFILLLIEIVNRSKWTELIEYLGTDENPESWYNVLIPPAKRSVNPAEGYHTPKYQPGWLSSAQRAIVIAIAELQNNDKLLDPYVNNFVFEAENSSKARMKRVVSTSKIGFECSNNRGSANQKFSVIGFPLTRPLKINEQIRVKFKATTGASSTPVVTLLNNKNDVGEQDFDVIKFVDDYNNGNISNSAFNISATNQSPLGGNLAGTTPTAVASNGVLVVTAENANPSQIFVSTVRYGYNALNAPSQDISQGLEEGKSYKLTGEVRVVSTGALGNAKARVDISDHEAEFETTSTEFVAFEVRSIIFPNSPSTTEKAHFFDLSVNSGGAQGGTQNSGTVSAEFKNIRLIENPKEFAVVRKDAGRAYKVENNLIDFTSNGYDLDFAQNATEYDITLHSKDNKNQFIAFIDGAGVTGRSIKIEGFEIVDVNRNDYDLEGSNSLVALGLADARYNRKEVFAREIDFSTDLFVRNIPFRDSYVFNDYIVGDGDRNPRFWLDERSLSGMGWLGFTIDVFSLTYTEGIESIERQANISNPHEAYVKRVELPIAVTSSNSAQGVVGDPFNYQMTAFRENAPSSVFSIDPTSLVDFPSWLIIDPNDNSKLIADDNGSNSIPTGQAGSYSPKFKVIAEDNTSSPQFTLNINVILTPINFTTFTISGGGGGGSAIPPDGITIPGTLGASINTVELTVDEDLAAGASAFEMLKSLPVGIVVTRTSDTTIEITGTPFESHKNTPEVGGNPTIESPIKVTSADGAVNTLKLIFDFDYPTIPIVTSATSFELILNQPFTHQITTANDSAVLRPNNPSDTALRDALVDSSDNPHYLTSAQIFSGSLPPGLNYVMDANSTGAGTIEGTPTQVGVYGSNNDGTQQGNSTPIKLDHKYFGVQSVRTTNASDVPEYQFIVTDLVPFIKNISPNTTAVLRITATDNITTIHWGDDTQQNVANNSTVSRTY